MDTNAGFGPAGLHQPPPVDIGAVLETGNWGSYQKIVLALAALAFAVDGLANHRKTVGVFFKSVVRQT